MKLMVQPDAGILPVLAAIRRARKSVDVVIFRLDRPDMLEVLAAAVKRGVAVRALIAHTNRGGEKSLRRLEMRLLDAGVIVSRTAGELTRYHGKMLIVDRRALDVYGFNFTWLDTKHSRSFGVRTRNHTLVAEALKLFEADLAKHPYTPGSDRLVVSPENARERLTAFLSGARKQLLIYDPKVSDPAMLRILGDRIRAGVDVRIIGRVGHTRTPFLVERYPGKRLHVRAIVRDGRRAFIGSQSLRRMELEKRREIGLFVDDQRTVHAMQRVFEEDWALTPSGKAASEVSAGERPSPTAQPAAHA